ncbi:MAG TPA: GGDEF domain-containing protein [Candidatus Acidoferrales bacterium]|nr:GGDEF domain-containing protein [Candidatus Acidoferrales bacterium]
MFEPFSDLQLREMENARKSLKRLERRDSWLWWSAITVMLLLTLAVIAVSLPGILKESDQIFQLNFSLAIHALVGLVLLFNVYAVYQQWLIRRLRGETAGHLELLSRLKIRAEEFHRLATRDPLTGLSNRRLGEERLTGEVSRSERYGHPLSVLMLDLNRFKAINDQYGHAAGDATLQAFADRLNKVIRTSDLAVRLGGDEFLVILPECPAERIPSLLARLGSLDVEYQEKKIGVTSAAGWAGYENGETPEQLIERADKALYAKKREQHAQAPSPRPMIVRNP